jgi:hypothetical protein
VADFAYQIDRAGCDDEAVGRGNGAGLGESRSEVRGGVGRDVEGVRGGEEVFEAGGARVVDGGEDDVVVRAVGTGVEEGEEDLGDLFEIRFLSRRQLKRRVRGWDSGSWAMAARRVQAPAGLCATSSRRLGPPGNRKSSRRPGHCVVRMPVSIAEFVML